MVVLVLAALLFDLATFPILQPHSQSSSHIPNPAMLHVHIANSFTVYTTVPAESSSGERRESMERWTRAMPAAGEPRFTQSWPDGGEEGGREGGQREGKVSIVRSREYHRQAHVLAPVYVSVCGPVAGEILLSDRHRCDQGRYLTKDTKANPNTPYDTRSTYTYTLVLQLHADVQRSKCCVCMLGYTHVH